LWKYENPKGQNRRKAVAQSQGSKAFKGQDSQAAEDSKIRDNAVRRLSDSKSERRFFEAF